MRLLTLAAAVIVAAAGASTASSANTVLYANVGPGTSISLTDANGNAVTQLEAGTYDIVVRDQATDHNFHLTGPGVDRSTTEAFVGTVTWTVTLTSGTYRFVCDPHADHMAGSFTVTEPAGTTLDTTITSGPSGTVSETSASFTFTSNDAAAKFECALDTATFTPCSSPASYSGLGGGGHTFQVRAVTSTAVDTTPASRSWTISAGADPSVPIADPIPGRIANGSIQLGLTPLVQGSGLTSPNWGTFAPVERLDDWLFITDQDGQIFALETDRDPDDIRLRTFLDMSSLLVPLGFRGPGTFDERGLLGLAFHPNYENNGLFYTYSSEPEVPGADFTCPFSCVPANNESVIREWRVSEPDRDPLEGGRPYFRRTVMRIDQPQFNHDGGALFFGTRFDDRTQLYVTLGDGGAGDDQGVGHNPDTGNGQDMKTVLGKILRFDPRTMTSTGTPRLPGAEIYASGFRNPFRGSSDRTDLGGTGEIWIADVGQHHIEEINRGVVKGGNYGWRVKEGNWLFNPNGTSRGYVWAYSPGSPAGMIDPVAEYDHTEGVSAIGGFVYRGSRLTELRGRYVFAEYNNPATGKGRVFYLDESDNADPSVRTPKIFNLIGGDAPVKVMGLGQDAEGELYVMGNTTGTPSGDTGAIFRLAR